MPVLFRLVCKLEEALQKKGRAAVLYSNYFSVVVIPEPLLGVGLSKLDEIDPAHEPCTTEKNST